MPTYAYACTACDHRFEAVQSFSDDALTQCPECTGKLRKLFNSVGIVFKGSGFYRTDSRSANGSASTAAAAPKESAAAASSSDSGSSSSTSTSSDSSSSSSSGSTSGSSGSSSSGSGTTKASTPAA